MLAALLITASLALPTSVPDHGGVRRPTHQNVQNQKKAAPTLAQARLADDPNAPGREIGFVDHYMPFSLSPQALPAVKDDMVLSHVLGYLLPCGGLWGPVVLIDGAEFSGDVIASYLLSLVIWVVAITAVTVVTFGIGVVGYLAIPYLTTTAALNAVDRGLKAKGYKPDPKNPTTTNPNTTPPPTTPDTPPPSYAY